MKCPKCGAKNSDTNRFCRSCGCHLENLVVSEQPSVPDAAAVDEVALGEQLFEVWQLYSAGEIEAALSTIEEVSVAFPERSSVHSLFALIYERKAETELNAENVEAARAFLLQALDRYEKIVGMNPHSVADREKLATLRRKLGVARSRAKSGRGAGVLATLISLPLPVLVGGAVFLLVMMAAGFVWSPGHRRHRRNAANTVHVTQAQPVTNETTSSAPTNVASAAPLRIYTFPAQGAEPTNPMPQPVRRPIRAVVPPSPPPSVQPAKVPSMPDVKITPVKGKPGPDNKTKNGSDVSPSDDSTNPKQADGATMLARAIKLHDESLTQQAVTVAQQAIVLFDAEATAGKNAVAARRGAENAKKMIGIWQAAGNQTEQ